MKKLFFSLFVLALVASCGQDTVTVKGKIAEDATFPENTLVYLIGTDNTVLDSTAVAGGTFTLKAPANPETAYAVVANFRERSPRDRSWICRLIPEKGSCNLTFAPDMEACKIEGSALNDAFNQFNEKIGELSDEYRQKASALADDAEDEAEDLYEETMGKMKELSLDAIQKNPDNYIALTALMNVIYDLPLDELKGILGKCGKFVAENESVSSIVAGKEAENATDEGKPFVDFAGKTPEGADVKLSDYVGKGKWVLTDFWASWCGPCMAEIPNIKKVYEDFEGKDFMVLGVAVWETNGDNTASAQRMEEKGMKWTQIFMGDDHTPTDRYGILGIPTMILFAPDGTIYKRGEVLRGESMYKTVAEALGK